MLAGGGREGYRLSRMLETLGVSGRSLIRFISWSGRSMRTNLMPGFQLAVDYWFDRVLQGMGGPIRDWIYDFLSKKGISREDIPGRFEDVVKTLMERLGTSARVIAYRTVVELYKEFALPPNFDYDDSLPDRFVYLKERVVSDRLHPTTPSLRFPT